MKVIKDYLHLHLGCDVLITVNGVRAKLIPGRGERFDEISLYTALDIGVKPILRPLSSMTEDETKEMCRYTRDALRTVKIWTPVEVESIQPDLFVWLLSKHFDLFGLIDAGLAIDATTI